MTPAIIAAHLRYEAGQLRAIELRLEALRTSEPEAQAAVTTVIEGIRAQRMRLAGAVDRLSGEKAA